MPRSIFHSLPSATCLRNVSYVGCINGLLAVCILIELGRWKLSAQMVQMVFFPPFPFFLSFTFSHCIFSTRRGESPSSACGSFSSKYVAVDEPLSDWVQMISVMESPTRNGYYSYQAVIILLLILLFHFFFSFFLSSTWRCQTVLSECLLCAMPGLVCFLSIEEYCIDSTDALPGIILVDYGKDIFPISVPAGV